MGQCNLLIDRHVHKNGGTTLRHIFQSMPSQCRYYGGWRGLVHKTWLQILNDTIRLARHLASCRAVLILRYRDPIEMYFSFFKWDVAGRQRQRQVRVCHFTGKTREQATADGPCRPGDNFTQWVPNNLQTNILIDAERR